MRNIFIINVLILCFVCVEVNAQDFSIPLEPSVGKIEFDDELQYRDAWYAGGSTGFNISDNAGLRVFYWRAIEDGEVTDFDDLEIYGAEGKIKLPITNSFKPYLTIGLGKIEPGDEYEGRDPLLPVNDKFIGLGGAGLDISFINAVSLTGYVRSMFSDIEIEDESEFNSSWNYGASLNLRLFDKKKEDPNDDIKVVMPQATKSEIETKEGTEKEDQIKKLEERIEELEKQQFRQEEREKIRKEIMEEMRMQDRYAPPPYNQPDHNRNPQPGNQNPQPPVLQRKKDTVYLNPRPDQLKKNTSTEEEAAVLKELKKMQLKMDSVQRQQDKELRLLKDSLQAKYDSQTSEMTALEKAMTEKRNERAQNLRELEERLEEMERQRVQKVADLEEELEQAQAERKLLESRKSDPEYDRMRVLMEKNVKLLENQRSESSERYEKEIDYLREELDEVRESQDNVYRDLSDELKKNNRLDREYMKEIRQELSEEEYRTVVKEIEPAENTSLLDRMIYSHTMPYVGLGFGEDAGAFFVGARPHYYFTGSRAFISPEVAVGVGSETSFNALVNGIFELDIKNENLTPYLGLGAGIIVPNGDAKAAYNMIFGSELNNVGTGRWSVEFAGRNLFKYNQLSLGYDLQ